MNFMKHGSRWIICLLLCLCLLVTLGLWIHECSHDCGGEDCVICQDILLRNNLLCIDLGLSVFGLVTPVLILAFFMNSLNDFPSCDTPVYRKVKLTI